MNPLVHRNLREVESNLSDAADQIETALRRAAPDDPRRRKLESVRAALDAQRGLALAILRGD